MQPGLVHIKQGLSSAEQIKLSEIALKRGGEENGFWKVNEQGLKVLNQAPISPARGRIFDSLKNFPEIVSELAGRNLEQAGSNKKIDATHVILLYYDSLAESLKHGFIHWHQDKDPNDGDEEKPVVSFNIGDSCDFLICNGKPKISSEYPISNPQNLSHRVLFESGDVLIFGGPSRYIHHAIFKIHKNTAPGFLPFSNARLNFTFRYAPNIAGKEDIYSSKNFKSIYHQ